MVLLTDFTRERKGKEPYLSVKSTQRYGHVVDFIHDDVFVIVINLWSYIWNIWYIELRMWMCNQPVVINNLLWMCNQPVGIIFDVSQLASLIKLLPANLVDYSRIYQSTNMLKIERNDSCIFNEVNFKNIKWSCLSKYVIYFWRLLFDKRLYGLRFFKLNITPPIKMSRKLFTRNGFGFTGVNVWNDLLFIGSMFSHPLARTTASLSVT